MATGAETYLSNDAKSVDVTLSYEVDKGDVAFVEGWLGITNSRGESGDEISLSIDERAYQFTVPTSLAVEKGEIVYITINHASLSSSHEPADAAYSKTAGENKVALFKAMTDQNENDMVIGRQLVGV